MTKRKRQAEQRRVADTIFINNVLNHFCIRFNLDKDVILGKEKTLELNNYRRSLYYIFNKAKCKRRNIADIFNRDHSTITYHVNDLIGLKEYDLKFNKVSPEFKTINQYEKV